MSSAAAAAAAAGSPAGEKSGESAFVPTVIDNRVAARRALRGAEAAALGAEGEADPSAGNDDAAANTAAAAAAAGPFAHSCTVRVPFPEGAGHFAHVVERSLRPDPELKPKQVRRELSVDGNELVAQFSATEPRLLRTAVQSFFQSVDVVLRTIDELSPPPAASQV